MSRRPPRADLGLARASTACAFSPPQLRAVKGSMGFIGVRFSDPGTGPTMYALRGASETQFPYLETLRSAPLWQDIGAGEAQLTFLVAGSVPPMTLPLVLTVRRSGAVLCQGGFEFVVE